jgi:amino-acid N-acetyltransferase
MLRKARISDVKKIQALINHFAKQDIMLARSLNELYENLRDFWVIEQNKKIAACCALHVSWEDLAEIKCLAVEKKLQGKGFGKQLVATCLEEARQLGSKKVFVLTYKPDFFKQFGFRKVKHAELPHKVWAECIKCSKFPNCQEISLLKIL